VQQSSEGQWAAGDRRPLNDNERIKQEDDGLNVRRRIEEVYSRTGISGVDLNDRRSRFRWWGMYTQRKPGIPASSIGSIAPEDLEDDCFMLRVRIDGGALTTGQQLRVLGEVSGEFARDTADLTDRQNIQLHWVYVENVPEIWRRIEEVGLTTVESAGDTPRVVLGSPLAGSPRTRSSTSPPPSPTSPDGCSATPSTRTSPASSRQPSPDCRTWPTRSTMSRSSA
jgi:sulfite reductase (ferredoxin)